MPQDNSFTKKKDFEIAIVGGGVCGITCAVALLRRGISAHVYEATVSIFIRCYNLPPGCGPCDRLYPDSLPRQNSERSVQQLLSVCTV